MGKREVVDRYRGDGEPREHEKRRPEIMVAAKAEVKTF